MFIKLFKPCILLAHLICMSFAMDVSKHEFEVKQAMEAGCPIRSMEGSYGYDPASEKGPLEWGLIKDEYKSCATGKQQSPINFPSEVKLDMMSKGPKPNVIEAMMGIHSLPNNWELRCSNYTTGECGTTTFDGLSYAVHSLRFHHPSEHLLESKQFPLEAQIIHKNNITSEMIIISILFDFLPDEAYFTKIAAKAHVELDTNGFVNNILKAVHDGNAATTVNLKGLVGKEYGFCSYVGSYTSPPCTEGVRIFMSTQILKVSKRQVHSYWASSGFSFTGNNRPVQPPNGRNVTCFLKKGTMPSDSNNDTVVIEL